jgi:uncharacterized membrane protein YgaE (UPF0421/DUF939 family)
MNIFNEMANSPFTTFFSISSLVFLMIAVIGKSKFAFAEINPGFFGRFLALILGLVSLTVVVFLVIFPAETLELVRSSLVEQIQKNLHSLTQFNPLS